MSQIGHIYTAGEQQRASDRFYDIGGNAIVYTYPTGDVDIICAAEKMFAPPGWEAAEDFSRTGREAPRPAKREKGVKSEGDDMLRSMRRARAQLRRLALANSFDYFVTLTLDPERIDRYDPAAVTKALNQWCNNMVKRHGLRYVLVPEQHKDGAFHFHGFFAGGIKAVDSGTLIAGRPVYNLPQWPYGYSTAQRLYGTYQAAVAYVSKYIGKQAEKRLLGRWYYSGGPLTGPDKMLIDLVYEDVDSSVEFSIPGAKMKVLHTKGEQKHV